MSNSTTNAESLPESLSRDSSFWGMTVTQFLGGFNDNLFKQMACLMCVDYVLKNNAPFDPQMFANSLFALPFILFSGVAGFLADRSSKRTIVVLCKVAEIGIMIAGIAAIWTGQLVPVLAVLFLMGTHSAFFGPSKYGILPEITREKNLSLANGIFLMTTFLAIILGMGLGGLLKSRLPAGLSIIGTTLVSIAVAGTISAQLVRRTPIARPGLQFTPTDLFVSRQTTRMFLNDLPLLKALLAYSLFWFLAGIVQATVNSFGKKQLGYNDTQASLLAAALATGIAAGCITAGIASGHRLNWRIVRLGCHGILATMTLLGLIALPVILNRPPLDLAWQRAAAWPLLAGLGFSTGMFTVPLQVFLQSRPPADQKGRVIGAMNLMNWIGVLLAAGAYGGMFWFFNTLMQWPICTVFGACAAMILPVAILYRPDREAGMQQIRVPSDQDLVTPGSI